MNEERLNPFFDFNAKIEATIKDAKNIIEKHKEDNSCEPPDFVCLAYDTINCLNQLQQENKELKKNRNKAIKEIKKELEENYHLSYGVALSVINILDNYKFLKGDK